MGFKEVVKKILPPVVINKVRAYRNSQREEAGEKSAEWYENAFQKSDTYEKHYTESRYYPIWTVLIDRVRKHGPANVLEIGCGTGQLAWALRDYDLLKDYCGLDFSPKRIEFARIQCPDLRFEIADVFQTDLFTTAHYDLVIATEFLEHVEQDLEVIARIRSGVHFLGTVPNYPWTSHVRHFDTRDQVIERYSGYIANLGVFPIIRRNDNKIIYVMEGQKI
jgi:SAM-dependent methyltransferase